MAYMESQRQVPSAARTTSGNSGSLDPGEQGNTLHLLVDVTAASGTTPSLALSVEWSSNGTDWATPETADTFTAITAAAKRVKSFTRKAPLDRVVWAITGTTPSFTFSVDEYVTN
jgi:hypothetical protein